MGTVRWAVICASVGCSFQPGAPSRPPDGALPDGTITSAIWTVDTAEELAQGASLVDIGIEPWGALTPAAYLAGTVSARATDAVWTITQPAAELMWSALDGSTFRSHVLLGAGDLGALGNYERFAVDPFAPFSLAIEGEVYLQILGDHSFELVADDVGFLEIAAPGTTTYQRVVTAYYPDPVTGTFTVAAPGWYPFRIGFAQGLGLVGLGLRHAAPGQALEAIARRRLRARADGLRGLVRRVFDEQLLATTRDFATIDARDFLTANFDTEPVPGLPSDHASVRWNGQVYVTHPGDYTFDLRSDDGHRFAISATSFPQEWGRDLSNGNVAQLPTVALEAGWNVLSLDHNEVTGGSFMNVRVATSPDPSLADTVIPADRLRPVERVRTVVRYNGTDRNIADDNPAQPTVTTFGLDGFGGERLQVLDLTVQVQSEHLDQLRFDLVAPSGTVHPVPSPIAGSGPRYFHVARSTPELQAEEVDGTWQLRIWDNDNSGGDSNARVLAVYATLRLAGGHDVIAREAVWTSPVRDLGAPLVDVPRVAWTARAANPANVEVELRACPTDTCDGVAWSAPVANDAPAAVTPGERYLQARVRLRSNGARESELDALAIEYRVAE